MKSNQVTQIYEPDVALASARSLMFTKDGAFNETCRTTALKQLLDKAFDGGTPEAAYLLGLYYRRSDKTMAYILLSDAEQRGCGAPHLYLHLAEACFYGQGTDTAMDKAAIYYGKAFLEGMWTEGYTGLVKIMLNTRNLQARSNIDLGRQQAAEIINGFERQGFTQLPTVTL